MDDLSSADTHGRCCIVIAGAVAARPRSTAADTIAVEDSYLSDLR